MHRQIANRTRGFLGLLVGLLVPIASPLSAAVFLSTNVPNVMILFDSSGSMGNSITTLAPYAPSTTYAAAGYTTANVYSKTAAATYVDTYNSIAAVPDAAAQNSLNSYGFWFGTISGSQVQLFTGNYLNYRFGSSPTTMTKLAVAKSAINTLVGATSTNTARFGVMKFVNNSFQTSPPGMGGMVAQIGTSTSAITTAVTAITAAGFTPSGEMIRDNGYYFSGTHPSTSTTKYKSPIQSACQSNSSILISDGLYNGLINPATQSATEYTSDHAPALGGTQNIITNTIGFNLSPTDPGTVSLQQTAANGGGSFFLAQDLPDLEESLFALLSSNGAILTSPANYSTLTGTATLTLGVVNSFCISSITFFVDGAPITTLTSPPFTFNWNSNSVINGTHTITATAYDLYGNPFTVLGVPVTTNNDQTPPSINNQTVTPFVSSATISWTTNEGADTQVYYGLTTSYGSTTTINSNLLTSHTVDLTGLSPGTIYFYQIRTRDAAGNLATASGQFTTNILTSIGSMDHFSVTFYNGSTWQSGPGTRNGTHPYAITAGQCFPTTIEALDNNNTHFNFNGQVTVAQYFFNGIETGLANGIALANNPPPSGLGISSFTLAMTGGLITLDNAQQLCFYQATRAPGDDKLSGSVGDLELKVTASVDASSAGVSASYVSWNNTPSKLLLLSPNQSLAPATPTGITGSLTNQSQGVPFALSAYVLDGYFNPAFDNTDVLSFSSSLSTQTSFVPLSSATAAGVLVSTVTMNTCNQPVTLSFSDADRPSLSSASITITLNSCGSGGSEKGFYQLAIPSLITAGDVFTATITVANVNLTPGNGDVFYSVRLQPLIALTNNQFAPAPGTLSNTQVDFLIPDGYVGPFTKPVQLTYTKSGIIWIQAIGNTTGPTELVGASVLAGPMQVLPGVPAIITSSLGATTLGPDKQTTLTVGLTDTFGNGIADNDLSLQITDGTGYLIAGGVSGTLVQVKTNSSGQAPVTFNSGLRSETNEITVYAPFLPNIAPIEVVLLTSLLGNAQLAAYPSPVAITQRPLTIEYRLGFDSDVRLTITDLFGREVYRTNYSPGSNGGKAGFNVVTWDGRNGQGVTVAVGAYVIHMEASALGQKVSSARYRFGVIK